MSTKRPERANAFLPTDGGSGAKRLRVLLFAPHFAEYATRLAVALGLQSDVLLITEARNRRTECAGLSLGDDAPGLEAATYRSDFALRKLSVIGLVERWRVRRKIRAFAPDIVHIQEQGDDFTAGLAEELARDRPLVVTVHDPVPHSGNDALVASRFAAGLRRIRSAAGAFHVHGAYCETALRQRLDVETPIVATAHGVILVAAPGSSSAAPDFRYREAGDRYLFFGRMEAYKGLDVLLDAIDRLPRGHRLRFVLAGRGPELERHRERVAAMPAIEVVDKFLPPMEAIAHFRRARAVVVPYRDATQSGVISAAVGNGVPVIASRVGGLVDAVGEVGEACGLLVPPGDPEALVAALLEMDQDAVHGRLSDGARMAASDRFAWSVIAARLQALYAELRASPRMQTPRPAIKA